jgi:hypothetical protein
MSSLFNRTVPVLAAATVAMLAGAAAPAWSADKIQTMIDKAANNTVMAFTGGYGNVIGFHKFAKTRYSIFYADSVKSAQNVHSHTVMKNGATTWTFYWNKGQLEKAEDLKGNTITLKHNADGSINYSIQAIDGFIFRPTVGKVTKANLPKSTGQEAGQMPLAVGDPAVNVPVRVNACTSWPGKPFAVEVSYNYGQGVQTRQLEQTSRSGRTFAFNHTIRPLDGFRKAAPTHRLLTSAFPKATANACVVRQQLDAICKKTAGLAKDLCTSAQTTVGAHCLKPSAKLVKKASGKSRAKVAAAVPASVTVTAKAFYPDNFSALQPITATGVYTFGKKGAPLVIDLPCWDVFSTDFRRTGSFQAHGGACTAPVQLGRQLAVAFPADGLGTTAVNFQRYVKMVEKGCFNGTYESEYEIDMSAVVAGANVTASAVQPGKFFETYDFDLTRNASNVTGTYTFTLDHPATPGGSHNGTVVVPLTLTPVVAP